MTGFFLFFPWLSNRGKGSALTYSIFSVNEINLWSGLKKESSKCYTANEFLITKRISILPVVKPLYWLSVINVGMKSLGVSRMQLREPPGGETSGESFGDGEMIGKLFRKNFFTISQ